jgi:hypothetical protein
MLTAKTIASLSKMNRFFHCEKEVKQIIKSSKNKELSREHLLYNRWEVAKIIGRAPFQFVEACFLSLFASLVNPFSNDLARRLLVSASHKNANFSQLLLQKRYQNDFLSPSRNLHDPSTKQFYTQPNLPRSLCDENPLFDDLKPNSVKEDELEFFHPLGLCNGGVHWILYLYHLTKDKIKKPIAHMRALSDVCSNGFSSRAAFLQNFLLSPHLLTEKGVLSLTPSQKAKKSIHRISDLAVGSYGLTMKASSGSHRLAYIKTSEKLGFLFDPYFGFIRLKGKDQAEKLFDYLQHYPWWKFFLTVKKVRFDYINSVKSEGKSGN